MRSRRLFYLAFPLLLLVLLGLACGGSSEPVTFSDLPVYSGATAIRAGDNAFADLMAELMQGAATSEEASTEVDIYTAPAGTTWNDVLAFYTDELNDTDWESDTSLAQTSDAISMAGWTRGGGANEQALLVGHASDPLSGSPFIIVVLLSE